MIFECWRWVAQRARPRCNGDRQQGVVNNWRCRARSLAPTHRVPNRRSTMATRRTTMRSRSGTKLYAVRDKSGKFKDIQTYKRAHAADMRHKSKAETDAARGPIEKKVRKAAKDAVKSVRSSVRGAVAAVERAAKRAVKQVSNPQPARKMTVKDAAKRTTSKPARPRRPSRRSRRRPQRSSNAAHTTACIAYATAGPFPASFRSSEARILAPQTGAPRHQRLPHGTT